MEEVMEEDMGVYVLAAAVVVGEEERISELQQEILPQEWSSEVAEAVHMAIVVRMAAMGGIHLVDQHLLDVQLEQEGDPKYLVVLEWVVELVVFLELVATEIQIALEVGEGVIMEEEEVAVGQVEVEDLPTVMGQHVLLLHIPLQVVLEMEVSRFHMLNNPLQPIILSPCQLTHQLLFQQLLQSKIPLLLRQ